jgi:hypothetical protein
MKLKALLPVVIFSSTAVAQTPTRSASSNNHLFTFEDMMKLKRVGAPVPSPDGRPPFNLGGQDMYAISSNFEQFRRLARFTASSC